MVVHYSRPDFRMVLRLQHQERFSCVSDARFERELYSRLEKQEKEAQLKGLVVARTIRVSHVR